MAWKHGGKGQGRQPERTQVLETGLFASEGARQSTVSLSVTLHLGVIARARLQG